MIIVVVVVVIIIIIFIVVVIIMIFVVLAILITIITTTTTTTTTTMTTTPQAPVHMLRYLRWDQLELLACGDPKVDLALLKTVCRLDGFAPDDVTVLLFWEVMEELSHRDRAQVPYRYVHACVRKHCSSA